VPEIRHKIDLYRRLSRIDDIRKLSDLRQELEDRFGTPPETVTRLLEVAELRIDATLWSIKSIAVEEEFLVLAFGDKRRIEQLARRHGNKLRVLDHQKAYWPVAEEKRSLLEIARSIFG
jgi:transcription-repair coupling factor (superfamily II helicase)